ncbi:hypothetical protein FOA52_007646 [Chlamydomonas sp. UWO 241]|nr:hypothetical protein FOA52_007646 [Chlamydomonas sp. UWO 241]
MESIKHHHSSSVPCSLAPSEACRCSDDHRQNLSAVDSGRLLAVSHPDDHAGFCLGGDSLLLFSMESHRGGSAWHQDGTPGTSAGASPTGEQLRGGDVPGGAVHLILAHKARSSVPRLSQSLTLSAPLLECIERMELPDPQSLRTTPRRSGALTRALHASREHSLHGSEGSDGEAHRPCESESMPGAPTTAPPAVPAPGDVFCDTMAHALSTPVSRSHLRVPPQHTLQHQIKALALARQSLQRQRQLQQLQVHHPVQQVATRRTTDELVQLLDGGWWGAQGGPTVEVSTRSGTALQPQPAYMAGSRRRTHHGGPLSIGRWDF